jgi:hypothetical protein
VADLNGDGRADFGIALSNSNTEQNRVYVDRGDGTFALLPERLQVPNVFDWLDANGDGVPDALGGFPGGHGGSERFLLQLGLRLPAAPTGVRMRRTTSGVRISWVAVAGATSYEVSRNAKRIASVAATSVLDRGRHRGAVYTVRAVTGAGKSPPARAR